MERISSEHVANQLRHVTDVDSHSVSVFEERPQCDDRPGLWTRLGVAL